MTPYRLVVINHGEDQIIARCGNLQATADIRILMLKAILLKYNLVQQFRGQTVTLKVLFDVITSINQRFREQCICKSKDAVQLRSYDTDTACNLTAGPNSSHVVVRKSPAYSITRSGTPLMFHC